MGQYKGLDQNLSSTLMGNIRVESFQGIRDLKQTDTAAERRRSTSKFLFERPRPSEFSWPLTSITLKLNGDLNVTASSWPPRQFA